MISLKFATSLYNLFLYIPITLFLVEESSYKPSTSLLKQINKQQKKLYSFTDLWKVTKFTYKFAKEMLNWIWRVQFRIFHIFLGKRWAGANEEFPSSPKKPPSFHSPLHNCFHQPAFLILSRNCGPGPHLRWALSTLVASLFKWNLAKIPIRYQEPRRIKLDITEWAGNLVLTGLAVSTASALIWEPELPSAGARRLRPLAVTASKEIHTPATSVGLRWKLESWVLRVQVVWEKEKLWGFTLVRGDILFFVGVWTICDF